MNNIIKHFKSTVLGVVFIAAGLYLLLQAITTDYYIIGGLLASGTLLLFASDKFINLLEKVVQDFFKRNGAR